ncbi:MAG TPA: hypothetical protein VE422_48565 [Terriglobia bacterium]|nr:hypothetical protein [Terriglobia bacterium]
MKTLLKAAVLIAVVAAVSPSLAAQWPPHPSAGVLRTPDGKPDLNGPTPRTPDGKPDLSGIWQTPRGAIGPANAGQPIPGAPPPPPLPPDGIPIATFGNAGSGFKDGLPYQPWAADLVKKRMEDNSKDNPDAHCLPMGFLQFHNHPEPNKIIQTPGVVLLIYEANSGLRQIFTDGRALPGKDVEPWWYGYSIGKWEGDTLVVETTSFIDNIWLDVRGSPMTSAAKVIERFRRPNYGNLEIEITVDDSKAYTKPWTVKVNQRIMPDTELIEFICEERDATHYVGGK